MLRVFMTAVTVSVLFTSVTVQTVLYHHIETVIDRDNCFVDNFLCLVHIMSRSLYIILCKYYLRDNFFHIKSVEV